MARFSMQSASNSPVQTRMPFPTTNRTTPAEKALIGVVCALLAFTAWMRGGTYVPFQQPLPLLGLLVVLTLFIAPWLPGEDAPLDRTAQILFGLLKDPLFYLGAGLLVLLGLQWFNAGRELVFDVGQGAWRYTAPPYPGLPSAVTRSDAAEMLRWFFPAWCLLLAVRSRLMSVRATRVLLAALIVNASLLAFFGIVQRLAGATALYWTFPLKGDFFASFGYANHAAEFFVLLLALALGWFLRELLKPLQGYTLSLRATAAAGVGALLCFLGAHLSLSRGGIIMSWFCVLVAFIYAVRLAWPRLHPPARVNAIAAGLAICCLNFFIIVTPAEKAFYHHAEQPMFRPGQEIGSRWFQSSAAMRIWREQRLFGVGGWGYRHFMPLHIPAEKWAAIGVGDANVHCDPVQFLCEFGAIGLALITGVVIVLAVPIVHNLAQARPARMERRFRRITANPLLTLPLVGAVLILAYSLVDLPFRSPAILLHWLAIVATLPKIAHVR
jgi:hypothetical protein